jgi:hypothetical protein
MRPARFLSCLTVVAACSTIVAAPADPIYGLALGDPARGDRDVRIALDGVVDTATGEMKWGGDVAMLVVRGSGCELTVAVPLRRTP